MDYWMTNTAHTMDITEVIVAIQDITDTVITWVMADTDIKVTAGTTAVLGTARVPWEGMEDMADMGEMVV